MALDVVRAMSKSLPPTTHSPDSPLHSCTTASSRYKGLLVLQNMIRATPKAHPLAHSPDAFSHLRKTASNRPNSSPFLSSPHQLPVILPAQIRLQSSTLRSNASCTAQ